MIEFLEKFIQFIYGLIPLEKNQILSEALNHPIINSITLLIILLLELFLLVSIFYILIVPSNKRIEIYSNNDDSFTIYILFCIMILLIFPFALLPFVSYLVVYGGLFSLSIWIIRQFTHGKWHIGGKGSKSKKDIKINMSSHEKNEYHKLINQ